MSNNFFKNGYGGNIAIVLNTVADYDSLPTASAAVGFVYYVYTETEGHPQGIYRSDGATWTLQIDLTGYAQSANANDDGYLLASDWSDFDAKEDGANKTTAFSETPGDVKFPTEKLVKDSLDNKLDDSQLVTSFSATPLDTNIASEKLVKDSLDNKLETSLLVTAFAETPLDTDIPSEKLVKDSLDGKEDSLGFTPEDSSNKVSAWSETPDDTNYPTEKLVKDEIDAIQDILNETTKIKFTAEGGLAVLLKNKTGSASVKGYCVSSDDSTDDSVKLTPIDSASCMGVFYDNDIADGDYAWVVISGRADVYFWDSTVRGYIARTGLTTDTGEVAGQAIAEAYPTAPFATDEHFCEIGHVIETRSGAGLAKVILHFN